MRRPYRERFRLIITELGTGLAGRPDDLQEVLRRAHPACARPRRCCASSATRTRSSRTSSPTRTRSCASSRRTSATSCAGREAGDAALPAATSCARVRRFPEFLDELRPTMARLGELADEQTPLLADLERAAPDLDTFFTRVGPFSEASRPAVRLARRGGRGGHARLPRGAPGDRRAAHARRRGAGDGEAAAPVPPDERRPQARDRERPAREGDRAAGAGPTAIPDKGGFTASRDLELLLLADAQHQHAGRHGAHAARGAHGRAGLLQVAERAAEDAGRRGDVRALQLVPGPEPARHLSPTRSTTEPLRREAARGERPAAGGPGQRGEGQPEAGPLPGQPDLSQPQIASPPRSRSCSTRSLPSSASSSEQLPTNPEAAQQELEQLGAPVTDQTTGQLLDYLLAP